MSLPAPSPDALAASQALQRLIADDIARQGGAIPFSRFMELALYAPGLGYYSGGAAKLGKDGDFTTAPDSCFAQVSRKQTELEASSPLSPSFIWSVP